MAGSALLGVDDQNRLYWDGHLVEIRRRIDLTRGQSVFAWVTLAVAVIAALGTAAQGVDAGFNFGCKQGWWSCLPSAGRPPRSAPSAVAPQPAPVSSPQPAPPAAAPPAGPPAAAPQPGPSNLTPGTRFK